MRARRMGRGPGRTGAALAVLLLALSLVAGALAPAAARATMNFEPIVIERVSEGDLEDEGYSWSLNFDGWDEASARGWQREEDVSQYIPWGDQDSTRGHSGWYAPIDDSTERGSFQIRATGGTYGSDAIDAVITLSDWTYLEPVAGWESTIDFASWPGFKPGVFMIDDFRQISDADEGLTSLNFYTVGLGDLVVEVQFVYAGTDTPVEMRGHLTTTDLDAWQAFSFGGACVRGRMAQDNECLDISKDGTMVESRDVWLSEDNPEQYRMGLVEAYFDTTRETGRPGEPLRFYFKTSWAVPDGTYGKTAESIFFLTTEYLTVPPAEEEPTEVVKSADHEGPDQPISMGDEVEYTIDYQAHEQSANCRYGYHYTALDLVDVLPDEMRYVDGSGRLYDEGGADVTDAAGRVVYEGDNERPEDNTVRFEFDPDYLLAMPMEGEHYRFVFRAVLTEYPRDGQRNDENDLCVRNGSYALVNNADESWSNEVETVLLDPVLEVDKTADPYEYEVGDVISYAVTYRQTVPDAQSRQTVISDDLPEGLELVADSVSATGTREIEATEPSIEGNKWSYSFDRLDYGDTVTVTYQARALQSADGREVVNNAGIHAANAMDADDPEEVYVNTASVSVSKGADRYEGHVGASDQDPGFFEYTVRVSNDKEGTVANDVTVTDDSLPEGMRLGRNADGSLMVTSLTENGAEVPMAWTGDRAEGTLAAIEYRDEGEDDVHDQYRTVTPSWAIEPRGTGWELRVDHLAHGRELELTYRAYPEDDVSGWEVENVAGAEARNSLPDDDGAVTWVNQPHFTIDKEASNDLFQVNDDILYHVRVTNSTPGTLGRSVVISDLAHTGGVELDRGSIRVYDSRGEDVTDSCTVTYRHNPYSAETFIVETHRDLVAGMTDELRGLYERLMACTDEASFDATLGEVRQALADGAGAGHDSPTAAVPGRPVWRDGGIEWLDGSNPLDVGPQSPRDGSLSCETELVVEYRVKINDAELAGQTVDNTALVVSDEPNTATTDDETVAVKGPRLAIEKDSDKGTYQAGETGRYTLVATQTREDNVAQNVVVADQMDEKDVASIVPGSVTAVGPDGQALAAEPEYVSAEDGRVVGFRLETGLALADEEAVTVSYDVTFERAGATLHNVAQANADNAVGGTDDCLVEVTEPVEAETLLDKGASLASASVGDVISYAVVATAGSDLPDAVVTDGGLPEGVSVDAGSLEVTVNGAPLDAEAVFEGSVFSVALGDLAAGDVVELTYDATVGSLPEGTEELENTAELTSPGLGEPVSDTAVVETGPEDGPDDPGEPDNGPDDPAEDPEGPADDEAPGAELVKVADRDVVAVGDTVAYTVTATAGRDLTGVVISDAGLPEGAGVEEESVVVTVDGEEAADAAPSMDGTGFSVGIGELAAGQEVELTYEAVVADASLAGTTLENTATLEAAELDEPLASTAEVDVEGDAAEDADGPDDAAPAGSGGAADGGGSLPGTGEDDPAPLLAVFGAGVAVVGTALRVRHLVRGQGR